MSYAEPIARHFHETYERLAPSHGWETQARSRKTWADVPMENKELMIAVVQELLDHSVIAWAGDVIPEHEEPGPEPNEGFAEASDDPDEGAS
jgi:hypothetical protein